MEENIVAKARKPGVIYESRRKFLKGSVVLTGLLSSGSILASFAPTRAWALEATELNASQAEVLLSLAKRLYPHATLPDAVYAILVKDIDEQCAADKTTKLMVLSGIFDLNTQAGGSWVDASAEKQLGILTGMNSDPFFQKIRGQCIHSIYDNQMAFKHFGYQGESFSKGGYLLRGFDDLTWLPNPPEEASPKSQI